MSSRDPEKNAKILEGLQQIELSQVKGGVPAAGAATTIKEGESPKPTMKTEDEKSLTLFMTDPTKN